MLFLLVVDVRGAKGRLANEDKAVERICKAIAQEPNNKYFQEQLNKFEHAREQCGSSELEMSSLLLEEDPMMNRSDSHTSAVSVLAAETRLVPVSGLAGASTRNRRMMKSRTAAIAAVLVTAAALLWAASHYFGIGIPAGILMATDG